MKNILTIGLVLSLAIGAQATTNAKLNVEKANQNDLQIKLESSVDVYGLQFDVNYDPAQLNLNENNISHLFSGSDVRSNMSVYSKIKEPGLARVIMFDLGGTAFLSSGENDKVISIAYEVVDNYKGSFKIEIENIVAAGEHGVEVSTQASHSFHGDTTSDSYSLENVPGVTEIVGNYPNPFNPTTEIQFNLANENAGLVNVSVFDIQGRKVATLHNDITAGGYHSYVFDASNLSSGQYFVRVSAPNYTKTHNMTYSNT
jgi:hypothetical protein